MNKLIITEWKGRILTALSADGRITRLDLESPDGSSVLNHIYIGKVSHIVKNINAAFVDLGNGLTGFYSLVENKNHIFAQPRQETDAGKLRPGDEIVVQVARDAVKTKAPVLTSYLNFPGKYTALTAGKPGISFSARLSSQKWKLRIREMLPDWAADGLGIMIRTNAGQAEPEQILAELDRLRSKYETVLSAARNRTCYSCLYQEPPGYLSSIRDAYTEKLESIVTDSPVLFEQFRSFLAETDPETLEKLTLYQDPLLPMSQLYNLDRVMDRALQKKVWLKSGGYLVIEPTEALVVIDVNTGKYDGKKQLRDTIMQINLEAAKEIACQLQLRNLSGIIIVDFIDMKAEEDRLQLVRVLEEAVSEDPVKTTVVDITRLNLVEITRKKVKKPVYEQLWEASRES